MCGIDISSHNHLSVGIISNFTKHATRNPLKFEGFSFFLYFYHLNLLKLSKMPRLPLAVKSDLCYNTHIETIIFAGIVSNPEKDGLQV